MQDELSEFYHIFKEKISDIHDDLFTKVSQSPQGNPNSTPIQGKVPVSSQRKNQIMGSPLMDNLILNLDKRPFENFTGLGNSRPRIGSEEKIQFHKKIRTSEIVLAGIQESKNAISLFNIGASFTPLSQSPLINRENSPFYKLSTPNSQKEEPEDIVASGIRTPNFW